MRRLSRLLTAALLVAATPSAFAHYYGWIPGSSTDSPESGNRMAIVNLHTNVTAGPTNGFEFTDGESSGADPLPPTFSPDGTYAYIVVGGVEEVDTSPDAFVYVYNANQVHHALESGNGTPELLQKIRIVSGDPDSAVEPTGIVMSPANNKVLVTEAGFNKLYIWNTITSGASRGTLNDGGRVTLDTVSPPSPAWINVAGTRAYYCTNQVSTSGVVTTQPKIHVIDLTLGTPAEIASVDIPAPTQGPGAFGSIKTVPFASCTFELKPGAVYTIGEPAGEPADTIYSDSVLYIFSGYAGFAGKLFGSPVTLNDPFNIYKFDTATNAFTSDGNPRVTVTPGSSQTTFPPLLSVYHTGHGTTNIQAAGTTRLEDTDTGTAKTISPANSDLIFLNGMLTPDANQFYFGSVSGADGVSLIGGNYAPLSQSSSFYNIGGHSNVANLANMQPSTNGTTDRSLTAIVGFTPYFFETGNSSDPLGVRYDMTVASTDGFFGFDVPNGTDVAVSRKTKILRYRLQNAVVQSTINLNLVAGAYSQQPIGKVPLGATGRAAIADHLLGIEKLGLGADVNHDTVIDSTDIGYLYLN